MLDTHADQRHKCHRGSVVSNAEVGQGEVPPLWGLGPNRPEGKGMWSEWAWVPESFTHFIMNNEEILQNCIPGNGLKNFSMSVSGVRKHNVHKLKHKIIFVGRFMLHCRFQFPSSLLKDHFSSAEVFYFGSIYINRVGICWNHQDSYKTSVSWEKDDFFLTHLKLKRRIL